MKRNDERDSLDQLVATKIFGLRLKKKRMGFGNPSIGYRLETKNGQPVGHQTGFFGWGWHHTKAEAWFECPNYSTDISAAWVIWSAMAKVKEIFPLFLDEVCKIACGSGKAWSFQKGIRLLTPKVICKAALRIKGVSLKKMAV